MDYIRSAILGDFSDPASSCVPRAADPKTGRRRTPASAAKRYACGGHLADAPQGINPPLRATGVQPHASVADHRARLNIVVLAEVEPQVGVQRIRSEHGTPGDGGQQPRAGVHPQVGRYVGQRCSRDPPGVLGHQEFTRGEVLAR